MKVPFLVLLCLFIFQAILAQDKGKNTHFGFTLHPQISYINFKSELVVENDPSFGLGLGADLYVYFKRRLQFRTGLSFQRFALSHRDYSPNFAADTIAGQPGEPDIYKSYLDFNATYHFIGVPFELKLISSDKPNHFFVSGGLHFRYKINSAGYVDLNESGLAISKLDPEDFPIEVQKLQTFSSVHIAYEWDFNNRKLSVGPSFETSLVNLFETETSALQNCRLSFVGIRISYH